MHHFFTYLEDSTDLEALKNLIIDLHFYTIFVLRSPTSFHHMDILTYTRIQKYSYFKLYLEHGAQSINFLFLPLKKKLSRPGQPKPYAGKTRLDCVCSK